MSGSVSMLAAALKYARRGIPVFPLRPRTKEPFGGSHAFYDATTDLDTIRKWWRESPNANIGVPTGPCSGLLVLDVDRDTGGFDTLSALFAEHGELPASTTVKTGGGGLHLYFRYPAGKVIRSATDKPGCGLDVRATGGYVVVPPSRTQEPYEWLTKQSVGNVPYWLLELLMRPPGADSGGSEALQPPTSAQVQVDGGELIPEGRRNRTLYRIGCSFRARGSDETRILAELERINTELCKPPIANPQELRKIARSAARHEPGNASPEVEPEVLKLLDKIEADWWRSEWHGMGGYSARDVEHALITLARMHGRIIPTGVRVSVDFRTVALVAGVGLATVHRAVNKRLKPAGRIRYDNANRRKGESGAFVLVAPRKAEHPTTTGLVLERESKSVPPCARRLRWSAPVYERVGDELVRSSVSRLGKIAGAVVDYLVRAGGELQISELAAAMGHKRPRDLRRRQLMRLEEAAVVHCVGDSVRLTDGWLAALDRERELTGEIEAHRRDMLNYEQQREAYRNRLRVQPDRRPPHPEIDTSQRKRGHGCVAADDLVENSEPLEASESERRVDSSRPQDLTGSELLALKAIHAYERKYGSGSFQWDRASCKGMFYTGPISGVWPDPGELERIQGYVEAAGGLEAAAASSKGGQVTSPRAVTPA